MKKRRILCAAFIMLLLHNAAAQAVLKINPFIASGVGASETAMIERLVVSYISELKLFKIIDSKGQTVGEPSASETPDSATLSYILTGTLGRIDDIYILTMEKIKVDDNEKTTVSDTAPHLSDIVFRSRTLTRSLFLGPDAKIISLKDLQVAPPQDSSAQQDIYKKPTMEFLIGTWKGDKGLEAVRVFPNGTAMAVLSGGGTLKLRVTIQDSVIIVTQDQANSALLYKSAAISYDQAVQIAREARPMRWLFTVTNDGNALSGKKESSAVSGNGTSLHVDNTYEREALWTRISR